MLRPKTGQERMSRLFPGPRPAGNAGALDGRDRREENFGLAQRVNDADGDHDTLVRPQAALAAASIMNGISVRAAPRSLYAAASSRA